MIRVVIVDDHQVVRAGLTVLLGLEPDIEIVGAASCGEAAVELCGALQPDVVVLDLKMPGMAGWQAAAAIHAAAKDARILVFSTLMGDEDIHRAMRCGALGYITKDATEADLLNAVRETYAGRPVLPAGVLAALQRGLLSDPLSAREQQILRLVARGKSNGEIGGEVGLTENTVKSYMKSIASKLDAPDRAAAVAIAIERGWIEVNR